MYRWTYNINVLDIRFIPTSNQQDDNVSLLLGEDTPIGVLTTNKSATTTVFDVSQTVVDNVSNGLLIKIVEGATEESLGQL